VNVDADALTAILANRLSKIVPAGFHVQARDGMLWYSADSGRIAGQAGQYPGWTSGTFVRDNLEALGDTADERIAGVAERALDELQDFVDEATHDPWPGRTSPPRPHAEVRGALLHLWYGESEIDGEVVLVCEPIPVAQLSST